jgi:hypothetical protein
MPRKTGRSAAVWAVMLAKKIVQKTKSVDAVEDASRSTRADR